MYQKISAETTEDIAGGVEVEIALGNKLTSSQIQTKQTPEAELYMNPSQIVEDLSSPSLVTRELEQLVSKKHLDYENLSLLTDFLVKHPSLLLRGTSLSNRYKGYAYNCLAELLKFLQIHSALYVLGSSHSEFVELLQDVRGCAFDKDWLDGVEKRALFPDLQFPQDALQKLLDSKKQVTKDVEMMRLKIDMWKILRIN
ncbi:CC-NBS-LRR resistance protein [Trifolium medium]|uniref:CC-NBS-LRR resistance protein n=1 Tax=Trifolium medium TaxID=97028 RepID=A0A392N3V2_9FABA|nr:CC-NBS-LRR resistance protein [Trifolium medium]